MKIVIAEDEEILIKILREQFEKEGFAVALAADGMEAMSVIKKSKPDVVLLDLVLPKKNGFEVLEELKASEDIKMIPVIVLSNLGQDEEIKRALKLGATGYLVKNHHPISKVVEKVREYLTVKGE